MSLILIEDYKYLRVLQLVEKHIKEIKGNKKEDYNPYKKDDKNKSQKKVGEKSKL
jgi:hypothetical protein